MQEQLNAESIQKKFTEGLRKRFNMQDALDDAAEDALETIVKFS